MAGIVRDPAAERREQMTPEHGSDAGQNDVQLSEYAQHSRRVRFRGCSSNGSGKQQQQQQQSQESDGHITTAAGSAESFQPVFPIVYLTIVKLVVDT